MWDLLCRLLSHELYFARFQRDARAKKEPLQHETVQAEAGSVDNRLWRFVRAPATTDEAWRTLGEFWRGCMESGEEGRVVVGAGLVQQMTRLLEAEEVDVEMNEQAVAG